MRKVIYWGGAITAGLVLVVAAIGYVAYKGSTLDKESKAYADEAVLAITTRWDDQELMRRASPALLKSVTPEQIASVFNWFKVMGTLASTADCKGGSRFSAFIGQAITTPAQFTSSTTAQYACSLTYQQGVATVELLLVKDDDRWMINRLNVNSPFLMAHKPL